MKIGMRHDQAIMAMEADILNWDGKSAPDIEAIYRTHCDGDGFVHALVSLAGKPGCQSAATWLLKHHMEKTGQALPTELVARLLELAGDMPFWEARLHVLQTFGALTFPGGMADNALRFASECTEDQNAFVRAWAYYGLAVIAAAHPHHRAAIRERLDIAMERETRASVKVRLRKAYELLDEHTGTP